MLSLQANLDDLHGCYDGDSFGDAGGQSSYLKSVQFMRHVGTGIMPGIEKLVFILHAPRKVDRPLTIPSLSANNCLYHS